MLLRLENIGKIGSADIELNGITVIAGENNTGKSTVGKVLYSIFNSFYHFETTMKNTRFNLLAQEIESKFDEYNYSFREINSSGVVDVLFSLADRDISIDEMREILSHNIYYPFDNAPMFDDENSEAEEDDFTLNDDYVELAFSLYKKYRDIPDDVIYQNVFNQRIRNEFNSQINNVYSKSDEGIIALTIKDKEVLVAVKNNKVSSVSNTLSLKTEILYLDDPFILDQLHSSNVYYRGLNRKGDIRKQHLADKLIYGKMTSEIEEAFKELIINEQISEILKKINSVCEGSLAHSKDGFVYASDNGRGLSVGNISLGLKTFIIIKTLLINGALEKNGTIILDEPEIHLHPQWQLLFAEVIVLLQKEFGLHVLLTTHSPYFLEAIEVYSEKHKIADKCKFYLAENIGKISNLIDVTGDTEQIYKKLASPFQTLENERYSDD